MSIPPEYRSSIPESAEERVTARYDNGAKLRAEYWLDGVRVGVRDFFESGELSSETPLRGDHYHGMVYRWDLPGLLISATPYHDGLEHGTAHQWSFDGRYLGSYTMEYGSGLDLWRSECGGAIRLSEARSYRDGRLHGFEWWICADQRSVYEEGHYLEGQPHGILRQWNRHGRLRRGYPQYYVHGKRVTRRQYLRACRDDASLPRFQPEDNLPARSFPPEVARQLGPGK
jgi:antitoxin component YwqK of YwqJK toxin-antitoxin module